MLGVIDDCTRECIGFIADTWLSGARVARELNAIIRLYRKPKTIVSDNGPDCVSGTLQAWASRRGVALACIQPGTPQQNAYVERYNRTVRQEWLGQHMFATIEEARDHATRWLWTYNNERLNMAIGGSTPAQKLKCAA
jgi:putative transposase